MANPNEIQPASTDKPIATTSESISPALAYEVHHNFLDLQKDNSEFLSAIEKQDTAKKQEILTLAAQWEKNGDLDFLRSAGLTLDQVKANPLDRHIRLAAAFLKREKSADSLIFSVDFQNNDLVQFSGDLSDLLPANILTVDIFDQQGKLLFEKAHRGFKDGRPCYLTPAPEKIAFVKTGFKIKVTETQSSLGLKDAHYGKQAFENGFKEEIFLTDNSRKTVVKDIIRTEAAKDGKTVNTDKDFFDNILTGLMKILAPNTWQNFQKDGKIDFGLIGDKVSSLISTISYKINPNNTKFDNSQPQPDAPVLTGKSATATEDAKPTPNSLAKPNQGGEINNPTDKKLIDTARVYLGSTSFRGPEVGGGNLACALVASTILKESGAIDKVILGVDGVEQELVKKGWTKHNAPASAGDVVIWGRTPSSLSNDGIAKLGHKHIGIMTSETFAVNNNSNQKMPIESQVNLNSPRGVHFLSPPHRTV